MQPEPSTETRALIARWSAYCLPGGEEAARTVLGVRTTQQGQIRSAPGARWISFAADEFIDARSSNFCWNARMSTGPLSFLHVTDAYEQGHGRLELKAGILPLKKASGPDFDKGELQRYLASVVFCPAILLNHPSLEFTAVGPQTLRLRDTHDPHGSTVDFVLSGDGYPVACVAERPRMANKQTILTPWSAKPNDFREYEGMRIPTRLEVFWNLPEASFAYFRGEIKSLTVLR